MKTFILAALVICAGSLFAVQTEDVDGVEWSFTVSNGQATIESGAYFNPVPAIPVTTSGDLTIPSTLGGYPVISIGDSAFEGCSSLTSAVIPEGVTSIGPDAFKSCSSLTSVVIPEGVTSIGNSAFSGCSALTSVVIPEGVTSIGDCAFEGCSSLTSVVIPEGLTSIGGYAFSGCGSLTSVVIPEGVTVINDYVFANCSSLTSVVFPESVTSIGGYAFYWCSSLTVIQFQGPPPEGISGCSAYFDICLFPLEHGAEWEKVLGSERTTVSDVIVSDQAKVDVRAEMTTPKTMKVSYTVTSDLPSVKVRAVAFKDGVRSFANIVPVRTGKGVPKGESVKTNVEHTFVWEVASDWGTDLDKVAVEILVQGETGTLLPQEQITIPATETHKAMTITRNALMEQWLFDALVWCFAEGDEQLQITDGCVSVGGVNIAYGDKLPTGNSWESGWKREATALLNYLYGKMGYKVLAGEDLAYAERATRLDFADESGNTPLRQVSVKIDEGE